MRNLTRSPREATSRKRPAAAFAAVAISTLFLQACGSVEPTLSSSSTSLPAAGAVPVHSAVEPTTPDLSQYDVVGVASWYGRPYHGRRTASGEIYNMNLLTAAHPTLPFGTRVLVTNLENGRTVLVTINDRGPFKPNRIIDVSRRAASQLGFVGQGLTRVRVVASTQG